MKISSKLNKTNISLFHHRYHFSLVTCHLKRGFTLIELLVVIGVISTILAVIFPNYMGARERARDMRRKSDLAELQKALELYKNDNPTSYPDDTMLNDPLTIVCNGCFSSGGATCTGNVNIYLHKFPCDPQTSAHYLYTRNTDHLKYTLVACLENMADPDKDLTKDTRCTLTTASYTINEP
ncbi:hypothetical protein A2Y99_03655 [Candidatus Gottesmanbacteria bacterium RBG_13_37_7]|uniref:Type II secretion system protein GspG C-terminal domain-containing protein n=1 Tax=Candidatus Gottesmanbacteria bacterium RBG_13_37_7 TaxID=1798369 RepID=A0A1F5YI01_9BACT|nr:MAG: hypothetical protein A2Y99_03655 [Candidatus Gottesmanbacteria bacterium RBG_13_37_7]